MDELQLMTTGTTAWCADCDAETVFVAVADGEHCCTVCDAAVFLLDVGPAQPWRRTTAATAASS